MNNLNYILTSLEASLDLVKEQLMKTFSKDTSVIDRKVIDVVLSNPDNKKKLIDYLDKNSNSTVEIKIEGDSFSIIE
ncbi:hypothetical protein IUY40_02635 [Flavobacterium sp. ALJ2]|uniref:hypothetical protein n=1 Tax=Flavobacterium sp. ALJ2 TaxID=2786960 RepID=UPI00189F2EA3|nr:hypothetical protein [Flavobacterium sp. ALJ2]MBF7090441.1 hypothetical protein [Flavobacterium sp. ALJ2]